ncbi:endonuclease/exonuclease/phosphatase family protein [Novosphingobium sp. RD2P27]|uniref:Endonuclease/exonuclease/phosphatase family protein n=1 Tax=Novosphingobium kalidii TaxID=3230299 RepID=A0ABV2D1N0_9SPHN
MTTESPNAGTALIAIRSVAATAVAFLAIGQGGRFYPVLDIANAFLAPLLVLLVVLLALALKLKDRPTAVVTAVALTIAALQFANPMAVSHAQTSGAADLRLLTQSTWHDNKHPKQLQRFLETQGADIVVLQETDGSASRVVAGVLPDYHRVRSCSQAVCSLTIISRWPLRRIATRARDGPLADMLIADVDAPFGSFRLINVHLPRPYRANASKLNAQLLAEIEAGKEPPLIVAGDFNHVVNSFSLSRFARASGLTAIEGFRPTYPAHLPLPAIIGIDHVFVSAEWAAVACRTVRGAGSDHHGIGCRLRLDRILTGH